MGRPAQPEPLPSGVTPLFKDPHLDDILVSLPDCDEWGIRKDWAPPSAFPWLASRTTPCSLSSSPDAGTRSSKGKPLSHQAPPPGRSLLRSSQGRRRGPTSLTRGPAPAPDRPRRALRIVESEEEKEDEIPLIRRSRAIARRPSNGPPSAASSPQGSPVRSSAPTPGILGMSGGWQVLLDPVRYI